MPGKDLPVQGPADVQGHFLRTFQKQTPYLFISFFWQEDVVVVPKQQKPHFTPKSANRKTDGG